MQRAAISVRSFLLSDASLLIFLRLYFTTQSSLHTKPMKTRSRRIYESAGLTLALGLLGTLLLNDTPWGLNVTLWVHAVCFTTLGMVLRWRETGSPQEAMILMGALIFAVAFSVRTSFPLRFVLLLGVLAFLLLAVQQAQTQSIHAMLRAGLGHLSLIRAFYASWLRLLPDVLRFDYETLDTSGTHRHAPGLLRGLAIATPVLVLFGFLLASADDTFHGLLISTLSIDVGMTMRRAVQVIFFGGIAAGLLRGSLFALDLPEPSEQNGQLGAMEAGVVLGLVSALFAAYVGVQVPYFFGGLDTVLSTRGLTVAEYARQGFFELSGVAGLSLILLLGLRKHLTDAPLAWRAFRVGAVFLLWMLLLMLVSAGLRMSVYVGEFGLSTMRIYVSVFLVWLGAGFVWFGWTVLRRNQRRFLPGLAGLAFVLVLGLVAVNPARIVVEVNAERAAQTGEFDRSYALFLGPDAAPALAAALPLLPEDDQPIVARHLLCDYGDGSDERTRTAGWKAWTWSQRQAIRAVKTHGGDLWLHAPLDTMACFGD